MVVVNDYNVNRLFGWALIETIKIYYKLRDANSSDHIRDNIVIIIEDTRTYVTSIVHDKDYIRLYYPLDDAIRKRGYLTLVYIPYIKDFSDLLKIAKEKARENKQEDSVAVTVGADIMNIMKNENSVCQFEPIAKLCVISMNRVKQYPLNINIIKKIIWEFLDRIGNATLSSIIRNFREIKLKRVNGVNFRTVIDTKSEK